VQDAETRRDRLTDQIEELLPSWSMAPVVAALQAMRGVALVAAVTVVAEVGDFRRFANPLQLMAYLGLVPSEHSSGGSVRRGGITKAGNALARQVLIEGAWSPPASRRSWSPRPRPLLAKWSASSGRSPASRNPSSHERELLNETEEKTHQTNLVRRAGGRAAVGNPPALL
jgi:hypothetical protein